MIKLQKILFPTDFSDFSKYAASFAISFACDYGAKLSVLHVAEEHNDAYETSPVEIPMDELRAQVSDLVDREIESASGPEIIEKLSYEVFCLRGKPFVEIIGFAQSHEIDLIVMGTHGRSALEAAIMGSTAERVLRQAPCPVLTVRRPGHRFVMPTLG